MCVCVCLCVCVCVYECQVRCLNTQKSDRVKSQCDVVERTMLFRYRTPFERTRVVQQKALTQILFRDLRGDANSKCKKKFVA